jgi:dihydroorotate dehydrogenase
MLFDVTQPLFRRIDAERAHSLALLGLRVASGLLDAPDGAALSSLNTRCMGLAFPTPLGLAAGCDKNGDFIDALGALGFGFIEIGTVTPRPQPGNPRPRLFRVRGDMAVINRMGFNNKGVHYAVERLRRRTFRGICGVNIGKNATTPQANAPDDYLACFKAVYAHADYVTVNISSPNTPGLRSLQSEEGIHSVVAPLLMERQKLEREHGRFVPVLVKIAPDLDSDGIQAVCSAVQSLGVDGVVATNTTTDLGVLGALPAGASGGVSGRPLLTRSLRVVKELRATLGADVPIIGVGGITDCAAACEMLHAGANLLQIYTGFVYRGPALLRAIHESLQA